MLCFVILWLNLYIYSLISIFFVLILSAEPRAKESKSPEIWLAFSAHWRPLLVRARALMTSAARCVSQTRFCASFLSFLESECFCATVTESTFTHMKTVEEKQDHLEADGASMSLCDG